MAKAHKNGRVEYLDINIITMFLLLKYVFLFY